MKAILLAAGRGERFYPFDAHRAKPMFPVCNRPLLAWLVDRVVAAGISDVGIVVGWQDGSVRSYFGDGSQFGCRITYIDQPSPGGTAEAVVLARTFVSDSPVLVALGDLYLSEEILPAVIGAYAQGDGSGIAAVQRVNNIFERTRVTVDGSGNLTDAVWKPRGLSGTALVGVYAFSPALLDDLANVPDAVKVQNGVAPQEGKQIESVVSVCARGGRPLRSVGVEGTILDMDYPWQPDTFGNCIVTALANDLSESIIADSATVDPNARIEGPIVVGEHVVIGRDAYIEGPAWIGERTQVVEGSHIGRHTMIGTDCVIGPYAKVNGFVGDDCRITYLGEFAGTMLAGGRVTHQIQLSGVFGLGAELGAGTQCGTLRFDDGPIEVEVRGQRRKAPGFSGILFGDYARTGVGAMMMPGRIVGPGSMVGAGVVLMKNVPPHKALLLKQDTKLVDWPRELYDK